MSSWDKFAYYGGISGLVAAVASMFVLAMIGQYVLAGKAAIGIILWGSLFARGRRAKAEANAKRLYEMLQEELHTTEGISK